jgi:hypothetical protein
MYSTEEWKRDNGVTDNDLINIYKAPENRDGDPPSKTKDEKKYDGLVNMIAWALHGHQEVGKVINNGLGKSDATYEENLEVGLNVFMFLLSTPTMTRSLAEFNSGSFFGRRTPIKGMSNADARLWYNKQLKMLNTSVRFTEENARYLHAQRNSLKMQTRALMNDRKAAALLESTDPIRSFDFYVDKYSSQGYSGEALWSRIISGTTTPNPKVNAKFGIK